MNERQSATDIEPTPELEGTDSGERSRGPIPARAEAASERAERPKSELTTADLASAGTVGDRTTDTRADTTNEAEPLFAKNDADAFRSSWQSIQAGFVDEPRRAVEQADTLVAEVIQRLAKVFADERSTLEAEWSADGDVETEQLRVALRRYRSFFDRLLSV
ncbi:MAG: hypothetical protein ABR525_05630 [Candidatus Limnocylindria bacterium]